MIYQISTVFLSLLLVDSCQCLRYVSGDFFEDSKGKGPDGLPYPRKLIDKYLKESFLGNRLGRSFESIQDPLKSRQQLLENYSKLKYGDRRELGRNHGSRSFHSDDFSSRFVHQGIVPPTPKKDEYPPMSENCPPSPVPQNVCATKFNTTAPMYGVSLTSGERVTIVQKFPDLLQQVIFEVCTSDTCDVLHGDCIQTFLPYLFLVIPLGPVTLTGQDYVLVESGCVCRPKYASKEPSPNPFEAIAAPHRNKTPVPEV